MRRQSGNLSATHPPIVLLTPVRHGLERTFPITRRPVSTFLFVELYQNGIQIFDITDAPNQSELDFMTPYSRFSILLVPGKLGSLSGLGFRQILLSDIQSGCSLWMPPPF